MKRYLHILTALLLLFSTMGISITRHYCGDVLSKVYIASPDKDCCGDNPADDKCCHSESQLIVLDSKFKIQSFDNLVPAPQLPLIADLSLITQSIALYQENPAFGNLFNHPPPPLYNSFQVSLQVFRL